MLLCTVYVGVCWPTGAISAWKSNLDCQSLYEGYDTDLVMGYPVKFRHALRRKHASAGAVQRRLLVQQLLDSPALSTRVDVFLYEQHWLKATRASQRACSSGSELCIAPGFHRNRHIRREQRGSTCTDVHRLFARLRSRGILAHAWY